MRRAGCHDYQAFLHEAGHALHYAGCDPELPYTFRALSRDHALTEIYSYIFEAITREPGWHERYFGLSAGAGAENAEATVFLERCSSAATSRSSASSSTSGRASPRTAARADGLRERLTEATGVRLPRGQLPRGHGRGLLLGRLPPRVDPLRAAARVPRREVGEDWWRARDRRPPARAVLRGHEPTSEEIAERLGFNPLDTGPLVEERRRLAKLRR